MLSHLLEIRCSQMTSSGQANGTWVEVAMCQCQDKDLGIFACFYTPFLGIAVPREEPSCGS